MNLKGISSATFSLLERMCGIAIFALHWRACVYLLMGTKLHFTSIHTLLCTLLFFPLSSKGKMVTGAASIGSASSSPWSPCVKEKSGICPLYCVGTAVW